MQLIQDHILLYPTFQSIFRDELYTLMKRIVPAGISINNFCLNNKQDFILATSGNGKSNSNSNCNCNDSSNHYGNDNDSNKDVTTEAATTMTMDTATARETATTVTMMAKN